MVHWHIPVEGTLPEDGDWLEGEGEGEEDTAESDDTEPSERVSLISRAPLTSPLLGGAPGDDDSTRRRQRQQQQQQQQRPLTKKKKKKGRFRAGEDAGTVVRNSRGFHGNQGPRFLV